MKRYILKIWNHLTENGLRKTLRDSVDYISWRYNCFKEERFDRKFNINTVKPEFNYLKTDFSPNTQYAVPYEAIQLNVLQKMLDSIDITYSDYNFIDLGSGKARAILYAASLPFKRFIGVEFSDQLHNIAQENVRSFLSNSTHDIDIQLYCMDATDFILPKENLVLFLYNPFHGRVMESVVDSIATFIQSNQFELIVLYRNPQCAYMFDSKDCFQKIYGSPSYNIYVGK